MKKHAYLIIAHGDFSLLNKLLYTLDDPRNDIFLHVDKKRQVDPTLLYQPKRASLFFAPRIKVDWGGDTLVKCELNLLKLAVSIKHYEYYHLLSGSDLPLMSQDRIHAFFSANKGRNYMSFEDDQLVPGFIKERIKEYHFFQNAIGRKRGHMVACIYLLEQLSLRIQKSLGIDRTRFYNGRFYKGSQWFSITHDMVQVILKEQKLIRKYFYHSLCADELFLHTLAMNSPLKDTIVFDCLRYIDWKRGQPHTFTKEDQELLLNCGKIFARKFSSEVDSDIIDCIVSHIGPQT